MDKTPKISEAEWIVMKLIWEKKTITSSQIVEIIKKDKSWNHRTIKTLINRLLKKEVIGFTKKGRIYHYFPRVKKSECIIDECQSFVNRIFDGALSPMIAALISEQKLSADEINELKDLLDSKKKKKK